MIVIKQIMMMKYKNSCTENKKWQTPSWSCLINRPTIQTTTMDTLFISKYKDKWLVLKNAKRASLTFWQRLLSQTRLFLTQASFLPNSGHFTVFKKQKIYVTRLSLNFDVNFCTCWGKKQKPFSFNIQRAKLFGRRWRSTRSVQTYLRICNRPLQSSKSRQVPS